MGSSWRSEPAAALRGLAKTLPPAASCSRVERGEVVVRHVDLAAHVDRPPARCGPCSWCGISAMVMTFSVTFSPSLPSPRVAACDEAAALVAERDGEPVDLRLGGEGELVVRAEPRKRRTRSTNSVDILVVEGIAERQHRHAVADLAEAVAGRRADLAATGCRGGRARESAPRSPYCAGAARRTRRPRSRAHLAVIELVVMRDLGCQPSELGVRLDLRQLIDRNRRRRPFWHVPYTLFTRQWPQPVVMTTQSRSVRSIPDARGAEQE